MKNETATPIADSSVPGHLSKNDIVRRSMSYLDFTRNTHGVAFEVLVCTGRPFAAARRGKAGRDAAGTRVKVNSYLRVAIKRIYFSHCEDFHET